MLEIQQSGTTPEDQEKVAQQAKWASEREVLKESIQPAIDFLSWDLQKRHERGETLDILTGEGSHESPLAPLLQIAMIPVIKNYGTPVTVIELVERQPTQERIDDAKKEGIDIRSRKQQFEEIARKAAPADKEREASSQIKVFADENFYLSKTLSEFNLAENNIEWRNLAKDGAVFSFPDHRNKLLGKLYTAIDGEINNVTAKLFQETVLPDADCSETAKKMLASELTSPEKKLLDDLSQKEKVLFYGGDGSLINQINEDRITAKNISQDSKNVPSPILNLVYGNGHLIKYSDLNQSFKGTYFVVLPDAESKRVISDDFLSQPGIYNDFPKAALVYSPTSGKQELTILDAKTLQEWYRDKLGQSLTSQEAYHAARANQAAYLSLTEQQLSRFETAAGFNPELGRAEQLNAQRELYNLVETPEKQQLCMVSAKTAVDKFLPELREALATGLSQRKAPDSENKAEKGLTPNDNPSRSR